MSLMKRVVLLASSQSYRTGDFVSAARLLGLDPVVATDAPPPLGGGQIQIDLAAPAQAVAAIVALDPPADAVIAIDDQGVGIAALATTQLGLLGNPPDAVAATRDKLLMRRLLEAADVAQPAYAAALPGQAAGAASVVGFPVVVKPTGLAASRGVIRADDVAAVKRAEARIRSILSDAGADPDQPLLVEEYLPGTELVVEGLVIDGALEVLALIDKPDPLEGPYFEETILVTPSRHPDAVQEQAIALASAGIEALGIVAGPVHAEVRATPDGDCRLLELAARSIGGLCGRALTFGLVGESLEVLILRAVLGRAPVDSALARPAAGVLMLPIPGTGVLVGVEGLDEAEMVDGVDDITMTVTPGRRVAALPEGDRYLGFVFASGIDAGSVETALRRAAASITVVVDGEELPSVTPPP